MNLTGRPTWRHARLPQTHDAKAQKIRYWVNVTYNKYQDDPRSTKPSIKTPPSVRQIPVSQAMADLVENYTSSFRGRPRHSFLMNSQKRVPLSTEAVTKIFNKITAALPENVMKELRDRTGKDSVTAHDLRHTCAVVRLSQLLERGDSMDEALQKMRAFFGWSRSSDMPQRYARAVFEDRLAGVWSNIFDDRVAILRNIPRSEDERPNEDEANSEDLD